ncbi:hypothetical protein WMY93_022560 [Mugilogobius chulae]|uniref:Uncharacterized protein n=1 Tax=Mugilogobius chulae TaxID=88201 RepID=A0AAW0N8U7_9GOBI
MLLRSHSERRPLPGFSALLSHSTPKKDEEISAAPPALTPRESIFTPLSLTSPPPWVSQALANLEQGEQELLTLRERQQNEVEQVNRQLDNAVIEAQREERRLLEKIEQDHRNAQRKLDQVKRENAAAVRVVQSMVDQQIRKIVQLKEQIKRWGSTAGGSNKNQLQRGVAEVTQPWEISLTMKRVNFVSTGWSKTLSLGDVEMEEQGMTYPIGVCGVQGQKCALHSGEETFTNMTPLEIRKDPQSNKPGESKKSNNSKMRVVRKLRLSSSTENEDDLRSPTSPVPRRRGESESSQDEELESVCSETQGQDLFLAIPPPYSQESEGEESDGRQNGNKRPSLKNKRKEKTLVLVSRAEPSCPPEETKFKVSAGAVSPKIKRKSSFTRHSLVDLTRRRSLPQQTLLRKKTSTQSMDSGSPPSPTESEDCSYTYNVILQ